MDDMIFIGVLVYLLSFSFIAGFLPSDLFFGSNANAPDNADIRTDLENNALEDSGDSFNRIGVIEKIARFVFVPITIRGMPLILTGLLQIINLLVLIIGSIYIYDKARGI